jgi:hypothetical protein
MKKAFSLFMSLVIAACIFTNFPFKISANAVEATDIFTVKTDGFSCEGLITYIVSIKKDASVSSTNLRFRYDTSVLEVYDCDAYMKTDSNGDTYQNISGMYVDGDVLDTEGEYTVGYMNFNDYTAKNSDKEFVQITFRLKDSVLIPFSKTSVEFSCYEFNSDSKPELNIKQGDRKIITTTYNLPVEHTFQNNVCSVCGSLCFEYVTYDSGIAVTKYNGRKSGVNIPSNINGLSVVRIGNGETPVAADFLNMTIPSSVKSIAENTFLGTSYYNDKSNWVNGVLYFGDYLIKADNAPSFYYVESSVQIIADGAFKGYDGYILCEKNSIAYNHAIENSIKFIIPTLTPADSNTAIDFKNQLIFTSTLECNDTSKLITFPDTATLNTSPCIYFGTGTDFTVYDEGLFMGNYELIVKGDLDGDGVCDVIDAALASRYSHQLDEPSDYEVYAANGEIAEEIDNSDYQNIVNIALKKHKIS